jgi:VCBS repeat protein/type IX secretion system substrate protein
MKILLILILLFIIQLNCIAQFGPQQIISNEPNYPNEVYAADLDGDGDIDVLSSSQIQISWYENINGEGDFGEQILIAQNLDELGSSVSASDIDGDGDLDVLSTFIDGSSSQSGESRVVWNENLDGLGNFGPQRIISLNAYRPTDSEAADFDGDGDMDVLSISRGDDKVAWYRNLDGLGNFGPQIIISIELDYPINAFISDIDNDGDMDIVSHSLHGDKVGWFRNLDGNGTFSNLQVISTNVDFPNQVYAADLDGDGDMDVISTSKDDNKIAWYENISGTGDFGPQQIITTTVAEPNAIYASDIDNDGDLDLISASSMNGGYSIVSLINSNGLGDFNSPEIISNEVIYPNAVIASDIDQDGDADVLSSSQIDSKIAWYENYAILGIEDITNYNTVIYPNPCQDFININSNNIIHDVKVFNISGKSLECDLKQNRIDTSTLINGIYLLELIDEFGSIEFFKIVKR